MFLFVALGFGLYGGTYLFPLLAQTILGFTSYQTGIALLPGGLATAASVLACGAILNRPKPLLDARLVIVFGTLMTMFSLWQLGHLTAQSSEADTTMALLIRGFGMGFLFVPINQAAFASLKPRELQQGSGLLSLARQLGGSFGIAVLATYVQNHIQMHRADLLTNYTTGNLLFMQRLQGTMGSLMAHGFSHVAAQQGALRLLDLSLMRQASTIAYNDAFLMILVFNLATMPAILLLGKAKPSGAKVEHAAME